MNPLEFENECALLHPIMSSAWAGSVAAVVNVKSGDIGTLKANQ
ncbi:hypothetical protein [Bradyrhizobium sp. Leo121]|nr:hypothetical protein [Bradyrhizobium sp. Leo121]